MAFKRLFLIDATAFCYRAFYAVRDLSTSFGQPTNAVYGFVNMLNKILKEKKPEFLGVCFDVSRDTFRQKKFAAYKIQRPPMPDGLSSQIPLIKEIVRAYGITIFEKEGFEADDIIATIAKRAKKEQLSLTIISSDKDILQLVDEHTVVFSPHKDTGVTYDRQKVIERFGVLPQRISDVLALMGDDIDNIPGVSGIGEKTATALIRDFGSLEELLARRAEVKQEKLRKLLEDNLQDIALSRELVVLDEDVPLDFDLESLRVDQPDFQELLRLFKYLEFKRFLKNLPAEEGRHNIKVDAVSDKEFKNLIRDGDELILCARPEAGIALYARDKFFQAEKIDAQFKDLLANPQVKKTGHDLKKLKVLLAADNIALEGLYFDVMIAGYLLNPSRPGYGLEDLTLDYLNEAIGKGASGSAESLGLIAKLKPELEKELRDKSLFKLFQDLEMPLVEVLAEVELNGIKLDLKILSTLSQDLEKRLIKLIEEIYRMSGCQFNINSPKQLREILFERLGLAVVKKGKTGPSTDEEVLRKLADKHQLPALLLEYRLLTKLKSTYIDALPLLVNPKTGRVHTSFNQAGTETGRLSSSNPNLQNIPVKTDIGRQIRRAIIASGEDSCLLSCDYSQIELRILAHLSKDENLISAFREDKDIHKATASLVWGLEEKDIDDKMRNLAKRVNFGIVYGLTAYGLARDLNISPEEAQGFIDHYFSRYPKVKDYIREQIEKAKKYGFVATILGRRRYIPEINNKNQTIRQFAERQAVNAPIQGSASDLIKSAMIQIHQRIKQENLKARMILQIHDELLFDVGPREVDGFIDLVKDRMENVMKLEVPVRVDIKKGKNWLEMEEIK